MQDTSPQRPRAATGRPSARVVPHPAVRRSAPRVAVIGAGPGGLAASLLLARAGMRVTLFEKDTIVGGRTRTLASPQGHRFDLGPTFFLYPRVLEEIFSQCGERLRDWVELVRLDPQHRLLFEGAGGGIEARIDATPDLALMQAEIARLSPADAARLPRFLEENRRKLEVFRPVLERPFNGLADLLSPDVLRALSLLRPTDSVDRDLGRYFSDPRVRLAFSFQPKYLGMSPFRCPSLFTILSYLEHAHGVWHPVGGCGAVSAAMAELARALGVEIRLSEAVDRITFQGGRPGSMSPAATSRPTPS